MNSFLTKPSFSLCVLPPAASSLHLSSSYSFAFLIHPSTHHQIRYLCFSRPFHERQSQSSTSRCRPPPPPPRLTTTPRFMTRDILHPKYYALLNPVGPRRSSDARVQPSFLPPWACKSCTVGLQTDVHTDAHVQCVRAATTKRLYWNRSKL